MSRSLTAMEVAVARKSPAFSFYPDSYLGGTSRLSALQRAAYVDLLCHQWLDGPFSRSQAYELARGVGESDINQLLKLKFIESGGLFFNERLECERQNQAKRSKQATKSAQKRWGKNAQGDAEGYAANHANASSAASKNDARGHAKPYAQNMHSDSDSDSDSVFNSDSDSDLGDSAKADWTEAKVVEAMPEELREIVSDWFQYKRSKRQGYSPVGLKRFAGQLRNRVDTFGWEIVAARFERSMAASVAGWDFATDDEKRNGKPTQTFAQQKQANTRAVVAKASELVKRGGLLGIEE